MRILCLLTISLVITSTTACAGETVRGGIALMEMCPGDSIETKVDTSDEVAPAVAALLSPLLTGIVNQGLKTAGQKMSDVAKEANIDIVHHGDHFYQWKDKNFELKYRCMIVWSKGIAKTGRNLGELTSMYRSAFVSADKNSLTVEMQESGSRALKDLLVEQGVLDDRLPGILGVFDVELSEQRSEARLVPRFVVMDHSVREKKADKHSRTITFEFEFLVPGSDKPFGAPAIKLDGMTVGPEGTFSRDDTQTITSNWFVLPALPESVTKNRKAYTEAGLKAETESTTAKLAGAVAKDRGDPTIGDYLRVDPNNPEAPPCPAKERALAAWAMENVLLQRERGKPESDTARDIARYENSTMYYKSCVNYRVQHELMDQLGSYGVGDDQIARSFDVTVTMKEFRKRPFAEFFGGVLTDDTTRSALTSAAVSQIDPATRDAQRNAAEEAATKAREAYEAAYVAAQAAIAVYERTNAGNPERAEKYVDMEAKKRTANRRAQEIGVPVPYPGSGSWIG